MIYILYNPKAGIGRAQIENSAVMQQFPGCACETKSVLDLPDYAAFFADLSAEDAVVFMGGDGTLNYFVNAVGDTPLRAKIYVYKAGTGNDFLHDVCNKEAAEGTLLNISPYIQNLPRVTVNGKEYRFINNVAFGIDGWVCAKGQEISEKTGKALNYTGVAIKGLLGRFKRVNATVTVDGVTKRYKKVWLAPTLNGRYFGGGMMIAPDQDRTSELLTSVVFCGAGILRTLTIFPKIFTGDHLKYTKYITVLTGKKITVTFDTPRDLNLDGEVIRHVTSYTAEKTAAPVIAGERM